jgi:ABC-type spermidine/putrescine transport system permease subunit I
MAHAISFVVVCLFGVGLYLTTQLLRSRCSGQVIGNLFQISISSEKDWEGFAALGPNMVRTFHHLTSHSYRLYHRIVGDISSITMLGARHTLVRYEILDCR